MNQINDTLSQHSSTSKTSSIPQNCLCDYKHSHKPKLKFEGQTTNQSTYKPYKIQKLIQHQMPKVQQKHYDQDVLVSSYKNQFKKPDVKNDSIGYGTNSSLANSNYEYKPKKTPFYSDTQYKKSFEQKPMQVQRPPEYVYKPKNTKFQGQSSYKAQFVPKKSDNNDIISTAQQAMNAPAVYQRNKPNIPFQGQSSYKQTFVNHNVQPQKQPQFKYQPKNTKFQGSSSYKSTFQNYGQNAYKSDMQYCPAHPSRIATKTKGK